MKNYADSFGLNNNSINQAAKNITQRRSHLPGGRYGLEVVSAVLFTKNRMSVEMENPLLGLICRETSSGAVVRIRMQYRDGLDFQKFSKKMTLLTGALEAEAGDFNMSEEEEKEGRKKLNWADRKFIATIRAYIPKDGLFKGYYDLLMIG